MTLFENNLKVLKENNTLEYSEEFYKSLGKLDTENYVLMQTKNNMYTLKVKKNNKFIYLNSSYDPEKEAERYITYLDYKNKTIVLIGGGLGYIAKELIKNTKEKIIICEVNIEIFKYAMHYINMEELFINKQVTYIVSEDEKKFLQYFERNEGIYGIYNLEIYINFNYMDIFQERYVEYLEKVKDFINTLNISRNTVVTFSNLWFKNNLKNYRYIIKSNYYTEFLNSFKNLPVIIVSAGPSLNKNIDVLKKAQGKAIIISVYTALKVLDNYNIQPTFIAAMDAQQIIYSEYKNINFNVPFLYIPILNPDILSNHTGNKIMFITNLDTVVIQMLKRYKKKFNIVSLGGSIACLSLFFANFTGGNPIIFVGQDLSFPNLKTHAEGTYYDSKNKIDVKSENLIKIKDIYGEDVYTDSVMKSFLSWFNFYISEAKKFNPNIKFIDATEGGAFIEGTEILALDEVIKTYCTVDLDIENILKNTIKDEFIFNMEEQKGMFIELENIKNELKRLLDLIEIGIEKSLELEKLYRYTNYPKQSSVRKILKAFEPIDKKIRESEKNTDFISLLLQAVIAMVKEKTLENPDKIKSSILNSSLLYEGFKYAINEAIPAIDETIVELKCIIESD